MHPCSRSLAVSGGSLRLRLFLAIAASLLLPAASVRAGIAETVDITFPVTFPDFTGFDATITVNEEPCPISVRLALDAKGKYVCQDGGCTVGGIPVVAKSSVKAVSDLYSPVSGEVIETNEDLTDNLETLNDDAFTAGWMLKVKVTDTSDDLLDAAAYEEHLKSLDD